MLRLCHRYIIRKLLTQKERKKSKTETPFLALALTVTLTVKLSPLVLELCPQSWVVIDHKSQATMHTPVWQLDHQLI